MDQNLAEALNELNKQIEQARCPKIQQTAKQIKERITYIGMMLSKDVPLDYGFGDMSFNDRTNREELLINYTRNTTFILKDTVTLAQVNNYRLVADIVLDTKQGISNTMLKGAQFFSLGGATLALSLKFFLDEMKDPAIDYTLGSIFTLTMAIFISSFIYQNYLNSTNLKSLMLLLSEQKLRCVNDYANIDETNNNDIENGVSPRGNIFRMMHNKNGDEKTQEEQEVTNANINGLEYHF